MDKAHGSQVKKKGGLGIGVGTACCKTKYIVCKRKGLFTYIGQEAGVTVDSRHTDEEVQDDFEVLWPAVGQRGPHILYLRPCKLIPVLKKKKSIKIRRILEE